MVHGHERVNGRLTLDAGSLLIRLGWRGTGRCGRVARTSLIGRASDGRDDESPLEAL